MGSAGSKSVKFNPDTDIPSLKDKVILVTGGNSGLGKESVLQFAKHDPKEIWLGARSEAKAKEAISDIKAQVPNAPIKFVKIDLASFKSIREAAKAFTQESDRLDILLLNGGIMSVPPGTTDDGYEIQFGTNHMGHALLTKLLLPTLLRTADKGNDVRVTVLASSAHQYAPPEGIKFDTLKSQALQMGAITRYGQSKLANALFAKELARRYPQLTTASLQPGLVTTNLANTMSDNSWVMRLAWKVTAFFIGVDVPTGTLNQLWASTSKNVVSGTYYEPIGRTGLDNLQALPPVPGQAQLITGSPCAAAFPAGTSDRRLQCAAFQIQGPNLDLELVRPLNSDGKNAASAEIVLSSLNQLPPVLGTHPQLLSHIIDIFVFTVKMSLNLGMRCSTVVPNKPPLTEKNLPDQKGKVFLVTGASGGLGKLLVDILYQHNGKVYLAARSQSKTEEVIKEIKSAHPSSTGELHFLHLELDDLSTIKPAADRFLEKESRLDVLWNNAGVMIPPDGSKTKQGYELQYGVNNSAHFLFTLLLRPALENAAASAPKNSVRVVWVASSAADAAPNPAVDLTNMDYHRKEGAWMKYSRSKAASVVHSAEFARRTKGTGIISLALNPGNFVTNLQLNMSKMELAMFKLISSDPINGAYTELFAGLSDTITEENNGGWVSPFGKVEKIRKDFVEPDLGSKFWEWTMEQVKPYM
ncbi:short-chain alcohol dehydrogenases/reductase [Fusarium tjaetaba]|uniref:Short-chain alcohol dehydrogenases/reductase n=1 Tax=Fusarium tjaetaba TaxID=1567544 RepID=A0A8H5WAQ6_9HYPO|nr:short-chain alcohol dehydrogenases/reductase [Fusarium tjaetaba]KAF5651364.1 short-chain alcohol dehydrogenases/reductase [Fusarium tjaetaba]